MHSQDMAPILTHLYLMCLYYIILPFSVPSFVFKGPSMYFVDDISKINQNGDKRRAKNEAISFQPQRQNIGLLSHNR